MPYFFFSYSRADAARADSVDGYLYRFYDDLSYELATRGGIQLRDAGFLDRDQRPGVDWSTHSGAALGTCNVFVPLFSPNYFKSTYCGKEWHGFTARESADGTGVVPVWWLPLDEEPPANAGRLQDTRDQFGPDYRRYGLRYLMQLKENHDQYMDFLVRLTEQILAAGRHPPAPVESLDLASLPNAFAVEPPPVEQAPAGSKRRVNFVVVAAGHDTMRTLGVSSLEVYGDDWDDWRPYHPDCPDPIALRAQGVASDQKLLAWSRQADEDLFQLLKNTRRHREMVVLIVDPWAVGLPEYHDLLRRLDDVRHGSAAIVVPWTEAGPDTAVQDGLYVLLENWTDAGDMFRDDIRSMVEFETKLGQVLVEMRNRNLRKAEVARRVLEAGPTTRPLLTGPGS